MHEAYIFLIYTFTNNSHEPLSILNDDKFEQYSGVDALVKWGLGSLLSLISIIK